MERFIKVNLISTYMKKVFDSSEFKRDNKNFDKKQEEELAEAINLCLKTDKILIGQKDIYELDSQLTCGKYSHIYTLTTGQLAKVFIGLREFARPDNKPSLRERFKNEVKLLHDELEHPNILRATDKDPSNRPLYYFMDNKGEAVSNMLYDCGILDEKSALLITREVAKALDYLLERDIVHVDIKPSNIIKDGEQVTLIDFGLCRENYGATPRFWTGTPAYISPEAASGELMTGASDVYNLGATLYELITGLPPYGVGRPRSIFRAQKERDPRSVQELRSGTHKGIEHLLSSMLKRDPLKRPKPEQIIERCDKLISHVKDSIE